MWRRARTARPAPATGAGQSNAAQPEDKAAAVAKAKTAAEEEEAEGAAKAQPLGEAPAVVEAEAVAGTLVHRPDGTLSAEEREAVPCALAPTRSGVVGASEQGGGGEQEDQ